MEIAQTRNLDTVTLVQKTAGAEDIAIAAMGLCRDKELSTEQLIKTCRDGHLSILEHNMFTFEIECSIIARTHFLRHRHCSFTERSLRSTAPEKVTYPSTTSTNNIVMEYAIQKALDCYLALIDAGMKEEDARYILPQGTMTRFYLTTNARELLHIVKLRTSSHALAETRDIAEKIWNIMRVEMPHIFTNQQIIQLA